LKLSVSSDSRIPRSTLMRNPAPSPNDESAA
jgi:hypothetical protein